ncbi:hypothetical protein OTERR_23410 [Oryzomicrobium terrae]|uniref:Uncharacterized protein n=1 Tax=Oryzomicrobium terrae TaxID=1735038 RepID=A0A5C1ECD5_9RHOO|nr:hypothetical protein [Oryzomicrobium terrae]QEL65817.1 hypothetical protein OTERR_23410 [Oryzomicrobium terrae]
MSHTSPANHRGASPALPLWTRLTRDLGDFLGRLLFPVAPPALRPVTIHSQRQHRQRRPFVTHGEW